METIQKSDVLFQNLGGIWFIFSTVKGEAFYSMLPLGINPREESVEIYQIIERHKQKERELEAA